MTAIQLLITYTPGLNEVVFEMAPMDWWQWVLVVIFMICTFIVMEVEKAVRRYLSSLGEDTDDLAFDPTFDREVTPSDEPAPKTNFNDSLRK